MKHSPVSFFARWTLLPVLFLASIVALPAAVRSFNLAGASLQLEEVTAEVDLYYTSMRLNRALNEWNVEVTASNRSGRPISGPLVVVVESVTGSSGLLQPDGISASQPFFDLSSQISSGFLAAGNRSSTRTLSLGYVANGTPRLTTRVYAAVAELPRPRSFTRSLNEVGQPLGGVDVEESLLATRKAKATDAAFGVVTLGSGMGEHVWKFSAPGYLPVWRRATLGSNEVTVVPYPRLTRRSTNAFALSPLNGGMISNSSVAMHFSAGAVSQSSTATLTMLDGQRLPGFLPLGWSPLQAFWIEFGVEPTAPGDARLAPAGSIGKSETAALVRFDSGTLAWRVVQTVGGNDEGSVAISVPGSGAYALVVADSGPLAPPAAAVGTVLPGTTNTAALAASTAGGTVTPSSSPASTVPELVTGTALVVVTNAGAEIASGTLLRGEVTERYVLRDDSTRVPPAYDEFIVAYQRPGDARPDTLHARFPVRPLLLLGPDQLKEAVVRVELFEPGAFSGGIIGTNGGQAAANGLRVIAGAGAIDDSQVIELRRLNPTNFFQLAGTNHVVEAAFEVGVNGINASNGLALQVSGISSNATFVLARVLAREGLYGLEPRQRLRTGTNGVLASIEPEAGERLPGLTVAGQYLLLRVQPEQGIVHGVARNGQGTPAGGMLVTISGQPWLTFSETNGAWQLLAPAGDNTVIVRDLTNGDIGTQVVTVPGSLAPVSGDVAAQLSGPVVVSITPTHNATRVPRVTAINIEFNRAINPASLLNGAFVLLQTNGQAVAASVSLNLANTRATLLPNATLEAGTAYTVVLSTNITDLAGRPLGGQIQFTFTTAPLATRDLAAQLVIYEPGATNVPAEILAQIPGYRPGTNGSAIVVRGTPGSADPEVPVLLVNESSGETTTVLSKPDGSFTSVIEGSEEDFVSATFVNLNGTRVYIPVSRQEFDNGFVGLYRQGGILEAQSDGGPVQVIIRPESIPTRAKMKIETLSSAQLLALLGGVTPESGSIAGRAINLRVEGPPPTTPVQVRVPVNLTQLGFPTNEIANATNVAAALALLQDYQNIQTFEVVDQLLFTATNEFQAGLSAKRAKGDGDQIAAGFLDTSVGLLLPALGRAALPVQIGFNQVLVPLLFGPRPVTVKGKAAALPYDIAIGLQQAGVFNQVANLQTGSGTVDVPFQLAQTMGFFDFGVGIGTAQQLVGVSYTALYQQAIVLSKPLSGAFITLSMSGGGLVRPPGRLFPGMVYATTGADGYFTTVAPAAGANYVITASHPKFEPPPAQSVNSLTTVPGQQGDLGLSGAVFKTFFFNVPAESETPPTVNIAMEPVQPVAEQPARLIINASQPVAAPKIRVKIISVGVTNLLTGRVETNVQHTLDNIVETTVGNNARWTGTLTVNKPVLVKLQVNIEGRTYHQDAFLPYSVAFTGPKPVIPSGTIPPPDTNDVHGPLVMEMQPVNDGFVAADGQVDIFFNKPIDASVTNDLSGIILSGPGADVAPVVRLAPNQQSLTLQYPGLPPDSTFRLLISGQSVRDLRGQPLDQLPSTPDADSFVTTFRTPPKASTEIQGIANGRGSAISGDRLYLLDYEANGSHLLIYDLKIPLQPVLLSRTRLPGQPRDLAVIPNYSFRRNAHASVEKSDLVAVVGGDLDALIDKEIGGSVSVRGQYLWVVKAGNGDTPEVLASPKLTFRVSSLVTKVRWAPPYLVYQEYGQDIQMLGFVNLQELLIGFGSDSVQRSGFPTPARRDESNRGKDENGDGDYVDEGETLPLPDAAPPEFYGKHHNIVLENTTQKILDFSVARGGADVGVTLRNGRMLDHRGEPTGPPLKPMYRTLVFGGLPLDIANPVNSMYWFDDLAFPRWVTIVPNLPLQIGNARTTIAAALVSLQPDGDSTQKLAVINISVPLSPLLVSMIPIPESVLGGPIQSVTLTPQGVLEVAGGRNLLLLNPLHLSISNSPPGQSHPAIIGLVPDAGAGTRTLGGSDYGVYAVADGARTTVVQTPPSMLFVSFPDSGSLIAPSALGGRTDSEIDSLLSNVRPTFHLAPARVHDEPTVSVTSDLEPQPNLALHYYVMLTAPGGAGRQIELGLESLNPSGRPLSNPGKGFAPVRAVAAATQDAIGQRPRGDCGAPIRSLPAWRMSDDPKSPYYNRYLSRPFALVTEAVSDTDLFRLRNQVDREIIFSGAELRAFIEPGEATDPDSAPVIGRFAAQIDSRRKLVFPISSVTALTLNRDYIVGDNPPAPGGAAPLEDTYGTIMSHSGELRTSDPDLSLPSPRMPINIVRTIGNQDTFEGPFGVGWDFNYNQRLTVLDPLTFPQGLQMPLVVREDQETSDIAGSQDVLFNSGQGSVTHFRWVSDTMPPEYAQDPLVSEFGYQALVSDYYLPQRGTFDLLVKFKDGRFERLTPGGVRYRYSSGGRLETIIDAYPENRHVLQYDRNGWLVRIDDKSVTSDRFVEIGHFRRRDSDPDFVSGLDENTSNAYLEGLICRLRDYTGRDVLFEYDEQGFLKKRLDIEVAGANGGFSGRAQTIYSYVNCRLASISAKATGVPYISAANATSASGKPVAQSTSGSYENSQINISVNNTAKNVSAQPTSVKVADGTTVQRTFDKRGHVTSTTVSGPNTGAVTTQRTPTEDGLPGSIVYPEQNSETMVYDSANPIFRSRANLLSVTVNPGPRGGPTYTVSYRYDPRYNVQSGQQRNQNGFSIDYALTSDGRDVSSIDFGNGATRTFSYNSRGQLTRLVDENGVEHTTEYSGSTGFVESRSDGPVKYTYGYDGSVASKLGRPASIKLPLSAATVYAYDNRMQVVQVSRGDLVSKTAYDELGRAIYRSEEVGDGKRLEIRRTFDEKGFLVENTLSGIEVNGTPGSITTKYFPDQRSRVERILHANGSEQRYVYDGRGNVLQSTFGEYVEEFTYDLNDNLSTVKHGGDLVRTYLYDGLDRVKSETRMTGTADYVRERLYYPGGQAQSDTLTDPVFGVVKRSTYDSIDALGRHERVTVHGTVISPQYTYGYGVRQNQMGGPRMSSTTTWDTGGNSISYTDPLTERVIQRDANGRMYQVDIDEQGGASFRQAFTFNNMDHRETVGDLLGVMFTYETRADGQVTKIKNQRNNSAEFEQTALGELQRKRRADGMEVQFRRNTERQIVYQGDTQAGFTADYDTTMRLKSGTQRDGAASTYGDFDPRSMPKTVSIPGGSETLKYDLQRRLSERKITYQAYTWEEQNTYDALDRLRETTYKQNGGSANSAKFHFDPAGPLTAMEVNEDGLSYRIDYSYYSDGSRRTVRYPSSHILTEERDETGRLTGVTDANANITRAISWQGNSSPKVLEVGSSMQVVNQYDARGRITATRYTRTSDDKPLIHLRYQYDAANNIQARQSLHRGGKGDVFGFDSAERLVQGKVGVLFGDAAGAGPALYQRNYGYNAFGLDYLTSVIVSGVPSRAPPFATNWTGHDGFLQPTIVDGFSRSQPDPKGNVASALLWIRPAGATAPMPVAAQLEYNALGKLARITRADGVAIEHQYQPSGLRFSTRVTQGASVLRHSSYVYDDSGRLLEEYDRSVTPALLIARYYYGSGDAPLAADLRQAGSMHRHYFLTGAAMSVIGIADSSGEVLERIWYDPFGQPHIERRDTAAPMVTRVEVGSGGAILVAFSEPIQPPFVDPGPGEGIVPVPATFAGAIDLTTSSGAVPGQVTWEASVDGFAPYSVLRFTPSQSATGAVTLTINAGAVRDEWGNTNGSRAFTFTNSQGAGTLVYQASAQTNTAPVTLAQSEVGSPFLFHGQYFDYESGLIYLRARHYDPYSGMFLQPDPLGYEDSVNHYAGFGNNPVSYRDPSGLRIKGASDAVYHAYLKFRGYSSGEMQLLKGVHGQLTKLGMGDLEIAAHVRVMYREFVQHNRRWEIGIRSFGEKADTRISRIDEFHQTKEEKVYAKTREDGLAYHEGKDGKETGEVFAGDLDGLYSKIDGQIASIDQLIQFQGQVNAEVKRLSGGWRLIARFGGQKIVGKQTQKAYQHGFSLNIPQEYGSRHELSDGGRFGFEAVENINKKMKKGIGEAFSFTFDPNKIQVNEKVDVDAALREHEAYYQDTLFNPSAGGQGFNEGLYNQRIQQFRRDRRVHEAWFPLPFYIENN